MKLSYSLFKSLSLSAIFALLALQSNSKAQWSTKYDIDTNAGRINSMVLNISGAASSNSGVAYGQPAIISLNMPGFTGNSRVILKFYGAGGVTSPQLYAKFMSYPTSGTTFTASTSNPANPNAVLPGGPGFLVAEVYELYSSPAPGSAPWSQITTANGLQALNNLDYNSHAVRRGVVSLEYVINSFGQFNSARVEALFTVVATPMYRAGVTAAQRAALDSKAANLASTRAGELATLLNSYNPYNVTPPATLPNIPGLSWSASVGSTSPLRRTVTAINVPIAADRVNAFFSAVAHQRYSRTVSFPEGMVSVVVTATARAL